MAMSEADGEPHPEKEEDSVTKYKFKRIVSRLDSLPYRYLRVELCPHGTSKLNISAKLLKHSINMSMTTLFGTLGGATTFDILHLNTQTRLAIIRCPARFYVKIRASLFTITQIGDTRVTLHTVQSSAHLMALACSSREYVSSISTS